MNAIETWKQRLREFPGLRELGLRRGLHLVTQEGAADCGSACLAMLAGYYGIATSVGEINARCGSGRMGLRASELLAAAAALGLPGKIVKLHEVEDLRWLDRPVIAHWRFNHFVVIERVGPRGATVLDPALGRIRISLRELDEAYTGVLLWFDGPAAGRSVQPPRRPVLPYIRRQFRQLSELRLVIAACAVLQLLALAPAALTAYVFGTLLPQGSAGALWPLALGALALAALQPLVELARNYLVLHVRSIVNVRMTSDLVEQLFGIPLKAFQERSYGDVMNRIQAAEQVRQAVTGAGLGMLLDALLSACGWLVLIAVSPAAAAATAALCAIAWVVLGALYRRLNARLALLFASHSRGQGFLMQLLMGMETLRAGGMAAAAKSRWSSLFAQEVNQLAALGRVEGAIAAASSALTYGGGLIVLCVVVGLQLAQQLSITAALLAYSLALTLLASAGKLALAAQQLQAARFQAERAIELMEIPRAAPGTQRAGTGAAIGRLSARGLEFAHTENAPGVLRGIELEISAGKMIAIVGPSGSGKSTLLNLLAGLYQAQRGVVCLDGAPVHDCDSDWLRRQLVLVPQFPFLFGASVRENLLLGCPAARPEQLREAARLACVDADIEALPMAYETLLAEGGQGVSGGQRQRLALARAILSRPRVLLLDEATSALDARTEHQVLANLAALDCTRVLAAHRMSTIRHADLIYVLDQGRIVQHGTFAQLERQPGLFRTLSEQQGDMGRNERTALSPVP